MRAVAAFACALAVATLAPAAASADDIADLKTCAQMRADPQASVAACTRVLHEMRDWPASDRAKIHLNRGAAYFELRQYAPASADFSRAIQLNPRDSMGYGLRGRSHYLTSKFQLAVADANRAIALAPEVAHHHLLRGQAYERLGRKDLALRDLRKAQSLDPEGKVGQADIARITGAGTPSTQPEEPGPPHIVFRVLRRTSQTVWLRFHSETRKHVWPGVGRHWILDQGQEQSIRINCQPNEKICYGAWVPGQDLHWGVGEDGDEQCSGCCHRCDSQTTAVIAFD